MQDLPISIMKTDDKQEPTPGIVVGIIEDR
jgi:hypothetical protein